MLIDIGDFQLAGRRGLHRARDIQHAVIVEIESGNGIVGTRDLRFLLDRDDTTGLVELNHAVTLRIEHWVTEHDRSTLDCGGLLKHRRETVPEEQAVTQDQAAWIGTDEITPYDQALHQ